MVKLGSTLESSRKDGRLANSDNIYDKELDMMQEEINQKVSSLSQVDEEDLTKSLDEDGRSVTKFADRSYSPQNFSGKGYKILRKNIKPVSLAVTKIVVSSVPTSDGYIAFIINGIESHVDVVASSDTTTDKVADKIAAKLSETMTEYEVLKDASTITLTRKFGGEVSTPSSFSAVNTGASCSITDSTKREFRNILTPVVLSEANTIYEIRYDFDLDGETIEMQEGSTLKFCGGSLKNGCISGTATTIDSVPSFIFRDNFSLKGIFLADESYIEWFGAHCDGVADDAPYIEKALSIFKSVKLVSNCYCYSTIHVPAYSKLNLNNKTINQLCVTLFTLANRTHIFCGKIVVCNENAETCFYAETANFGAVPDTPHVKVLIENIDITDKKNPILQYKSKFIDFKFVAENNVQKNFYYGITLSNINAVHYGAFAFVQCYGLISIDSWVTGLDFINCSAAGHEWFYFFRKEKDLSIKDIDSRSPARVNFIGGELQPNPKTVAHMYMQTPTNARIYNTNWDVSTTTSKCYIIYNELLYTHRNNYDTYVQNYPYEVNTIGSDNLGTIKRWGWADERKLYYFDSCKINGDYGRQLITSTGYGKNEIIDLDVSFSSKDVVVHFMIMTSAGIGNVSIGKDRYVSSLPLFNAYKFYRSESTNKLYIKKIRSENKTAIVPFSLETGIHSSEPFGNDPNGGARGASFNYIKTVGKNISYISALPEDAVEIVYSPRRNDMFIEGDDGKTYRLRVNELGNICLEYTYGFGDFINNASSPLATFKTDTASFNSRSTYGGNSVKEGEFGEILQIKGKSVVSNDEINNSNISVFKSVGIEDWRGRNWESKVDFSDIMKEYFNDGFKSAGDIYDEINKDKIIIRVGVIKDLSTLTWIKDEDYSNVFYTKETYTKIGSDSKIANVLCSKYSRESSFGLVQTDKTICMNGSIKIHDSAFTDAESLKNSLANVSINYELSTQYEISHETYMKFRTISNGKEMIIPSNEIVQPTFDLRYEI